MSDFQRIGNRVPYGEVIVGLEDVEPIRQVATQGLMLAARSLKFNWADNLDVVSYAHYFNAGPDPQLADRFITVQSANSCDPDFWRLGVSCRTFVADQRHSMKRVHYLLEGTASELLTAKKEVYLVLGLSNLVVLNGVPEEQVATARKRYERPLTLDDCDRVLSTLTSAEKRSKVLLARR